MPSTLNYYLYWLRANPVVGVVAGIFWLWMLVDAIRRREWIWVLFMVIFQGFTSLFYFFFVYRAAPSATQGFELPGASRRHRIRELEGLIHNLDKAHHHLELGDIYFRQGNLSKAEACYRSSLERDSQDIDARAHLGQCLLRQKRAEEARPILQQVCTENPKHDYGHSLMAYAETLGALGDIDNAITVWKQVLQDHAYARARVQLGELYLFKSQKELADVEFREVISDDRHAPAFQRKRDHVWVRRAKRLLR
jgi:tetratricopeptide (TPR) repeat protein